MFNFGNKIKSVSIGPSTEYIIWEQNIEEIGRDCTLNVGSGCVGIYIVDGVLKSVNTPGRWVIKSKDEDKAGAKLQLIGVNTDKVFEIFCGVGNIPCHDYDLDIEATLGAHGDCQIRITHPWSLYNTFGHAPITADEIDGFVKAKLVEIMTSLLSEAGSKYDYDRIKSMQTEISNELEKKFAKYLLSIGLEVVSFSLRGINFDEDYINKRQEYFDRQNKIKQDKRERREAERMQRAEIDNIIALTEAANRVAPQAPAAPAAPQNDLNQPVQYCPKCGTKTLKTSSFCPGCGQKLN